MAKQEIRSSRRQLGLIALAGFIALVSFALSAHGQVQPTQAPKMNTGNMDGGDQEVAHPFFAHMGMPEAVGVYSLRLGALLTRAEGNRDGDFAFHFETGLTKFIGVHLRNNGILDRQHTELMFQFAAVRSEDGMSGFAPIIEFEFPTYSGGDQHINTLVGFSTALADSKAAFNQVVHYDPRTDTVEGDAAFVLKLGTRLFPVVEMSGEGMPGERPIINLLGGMKVRVNKSLLLGLAIQAPVTRREDFSWQLVLQPDIEWGKMK
jgi:hypothetical protein